MTERYSEGLMQKYREHLEQAEQHYDCISTRIISQIDGSGTFLLVTDLETHDSTLDYFPTDYQLPPK